MQKRKPAPRPCHASMRKTKVRPFGTRRHSKNEGLTPRVAILADGGNCCNGRGKSRFPIAADGDEVRAVGCQRRGKHAVQDLTRSRGVADVVDRPWHLDI